MKLTRRQFHTLAAGFSLAASAQSAPPRPDRKDCFFGMHFDLHPRDTDEALGRDVTPEMVERFLDRVKPDYVQYDYKGHIGYIGYPSNVSSHAPVVKDSLAIWREVTARRGVSLYIHFSGVLDQRAVEERPEWARIGPDGKPSARETSTFSSYVDERMIPQLKEAITKYGIDGAWVDGECWGTNPDYGTDAAKAFQAVSAIYPPPRKPGEDGWLTWLEFCRQRFRDYLQHYVGTLHEFRPGFEIASNWLYTTFVPERPTLPVDFISGDYLGNACISRARLEARYLSHVERPWDLMAWGFQSSRENPVGPVHKSAVQLQQEASVVLAQGGGFQIYYQPTRAGYLDDRHIGVMEGVAKFCREREDLCHKSETVPEIGVLFSKHSLYATGNKLFGGWGERVNQARGTVDALVDNQLCADVIPDWKLEEVARQYPMIIVPDWEEIGDEARDTLLAYARDGGHLLLVGARNAALFQDELQVNFPRPAERVSAYIPGREVFADAAGVWQDVETRGAHVLATRYPTYDATRDGRTAATVASLGDGSIAAIYGPLGTVYAQTHAPEARNVFGEIVRQVHTPAVRVECPPAIEVVWRRKSGRNVLHLLNASGMQLASDYGAIDYVPPVGPIRISLSLPVRPRRVTLEPGGEELKGVWRDGAWSASIPTLAIHAMLVW